MVSVTNMRYASVRHSEADQEVENTDTSNIEANTKYGTMQSLKEAASKIINDIFHKVGDIKNWEF